MLRPMSGALMLATPPISRLSPGRQRSPCDWRLIFWHDFRACPDMESNMMPMDEPAAGAGRALSLSTIAFAICFAVWTIFSIIGVRIKNELGLSEVEFGLLVGTPILVGSLLRPILGIWTDRLGGRLVYTATMLAAALATLLLARSEERRVGE